MVRYIYDVIGAVSGVALFVLLVILLRGPIRKYSFLFAYITADFLVTCVLTVASFVWLGADATGSSADAQRYNRTYWLTSVLLALLRFLVVISLTYEATPDGPQRRSAGRVLSGIVAVAILLPFIVFPVHFDPWPKSSWFNDVGEMLNFGGAIMNLVLWGALIVSRQRDRELMRVSAGLGVMVAGMALSYGLRRLVHSSAATILPNLFLQLTQLGAWGIWIWTFWPAAKPQTSPQPAVSSR